MAEDYVCEWPSDDPAMTDRHLAALYLRYPEMAAFEETAPLDLQLPTSPSSLQTNSARLSDEGSLVSSTVNEQEDQSHHSSKTPTSTQTSFSSRFSDGSEAQYIVSDLLTALSAENLKPPTMQLFQGIKTALFSAFQLFHESTQYGRDPSSDEIDQHREMLNDATKSLRMCHATIEEQRGIIDDLVARAIFTITPPHDSIVAFWNMRQKIINRNLMTPVRDEADLLSTFVEFIETFLRPLLRKFRSSKSQSLSPLFRCLEQIYYALLSCSDAYSDLVDEAEHLCLQHLNPLHEKIESCPSLRAQIAEFEKIKANAQMANPAGMPYVPRGPSMEAENQSEVSLSYGNPITMRRTQRQFRKEKTL